MSEHVVPDDILRISQHSFIVHTAVMMWRMGRCSWDEAMLICVVHLVESLDETQQMLVREMNERPVVSVFKVNGIE